MPGKGKGRGGPDGGVGGGRLGRCAAALEAAKAAVEGRKQELRKDDEKLARRKKDVKVLADFLAVWDWTTPE